jgi:hypothetical protein
VRRWEQPTFAQPGTHPVAFPLGTIAPLWPQCARISRLSRGFPAIRPCYRLPSLCACASRLYYSTFWAHVNTQFARSQGFGGYLDIPFLGSRGCRGGSGRVHPTGAGAISAQICALISAGRSPHGRRGDVGNMQKMQVQDFHKSHSPLLYNIWTLPKQDNARAHYCPQPSPRRRGHGVPRRRGIVE